MSLHTYKLIFPHFGLYFYIILCACLLVTLHLRKQPHCNLGSSVSGWNLLHVIVFCVSMWAFRPTTIQLDEASYRLPSEVHARRVPLPLLNDFFIGNESYVAQYHGHGKTKIAYKLTTFTGGALDGCVLKVICPSKVDEEVATMEHLNRSDSRICVPILHEGQLVRKSHFNLTAWICGYALPLDVFLTEERAAPDRCMLGALI